MSTIMARRALPLILLYASFGRAADPTSSSVSPVAAAPTTGYCYYPGSNPSTAQNDRACDPNAMTSMCCPTGWTCMSNKICQVTDGSLAQAAVGKIRRATCTDPSWNETVCGDFCLNLPSYQLEGDLTPCGDNVFVCSAYAQDKSANCAAKQKIFTLPIGTAQTIISLSTGTTSTSMVPVSTAGGSTLITSASLSSSASGSAQEDNDDGDSHTTRNIAIGAAVGGIVALSALITLIVCCLRRRRRRALSRTSSPESLEEKPRIPEPTERIASIPAPVREDYRSVPPEPPTTTAADDDHPRYDLYDDGETDIATGGAAAPVPVTRRPEYLEAGDRELAGITGRAFVGGDGDAVPPRDSPPIIKGGDTYRDRPSIFGNPSRDMLATEVGGPGGRVSPLHGY